MSFLDWPAEVNRPSRRTDARRKRVAERLIARFSRAFPQVSYTLSWGSPLINAQAWRLGVERNVYLYGGLVRHPVVSRAGLALTLAHETGHHLGGEPYDPVMTWMSSEAQADHWAAASCMPSLFGKEAHSLTLRGACEISAVRRIAQLDAIERGNNIEIDERLFCFV